MLGGPKRLAERLLAEKDEPVKHIGLCSCLSGAKLSAEEERLLQNLITVRHVADRFQFRR